MGKVLRRTFLIGSAAIAGGAAFGYWQVTKPFPNPLKKDLKEGEATLTPYVLIDDQGVTIIVPRAEMGQGVRTTLAALVAEELDVSLNDVKTAHGPAAKAYYNAVALEEGSGKAATDLSPGAERIRNATHIVAKVMGNQITGGSSSTTDAYTKMRQAGAAARYALVGAAAKRLGVSEDTLSTNNGAVVDPAGNRIPYSALGVDAQKIKLPNKPPLKPQSEWNLLGKSLPRVDMVEKCTGTAQYAIDVRLPDMLFATVRCNPHLRAGMNSFDASRAEARSGVKKIVPLEDGVAIIATNTWLAMQAADDIEFDWARAETPSSTAEMTETLDAAFDKKQDSRMRDDGNVDDAFAGGEFLEATYSVPYLAHATMEPMNAVAHLTDDRLDIWVGTQSPTRVLEVAAELTGLGQDNIYVHTTWLGGGFGRRAETDIVEQAIHAAKAMKGTPIKLAWTREEDMRHDFYRPMTRARFRGANKDGNLHAFDMRVAAQATVLEAYKRQGLNITIPDPTITQNAWENPYKAENYRITGFKAPPMAPVGYWRSVGASQNGFFQETAIDEMAHDAGVDPLEYRLNLIDHDISRKVIEAVGDMSGWGGTLPIGHARGVAYYLSFGVPVAEVIEIKDTANGIKIVNAFAAVDVGTALDPANIEAQVQSAMIYGLTAAINGEITIEDGAVVQSNFHDYDAMRMYQAPPIKVRALENGENITGIGEPGLPPAAPALGNALFALTGKRIRDLPFNKSNKFI